MNIRYAMIGAFIGALTDLGINLLASFILQRTPAEQLERFSVGWLVALTLAGILLGVWLGGKITLPASAMEDGTQKPKRRTSSGPVTVTRLHGLLAYTRVRGRGIQLSDVLSIGSVIDIDSRE